MAENWWKVIAIAMGAILMAMLSWFISSNTAQWQCIGILKERVAKLEGMHTGGKPDGR